MSELLPQSGHEGRLTEHGHGIEVLSERIESTLYGARGGVTLVIDDHHGHRLEEPLPEGIGREIEIGAWTDNLQTWRAERFCDEIAEKYRQRFTGDTAEQEFLASDPEVSLV